MPWFERNHIGRPLFPHERQFVAELKQLLSGLLIRDHWGELRELGDVGAVSLGRKLLRLRALTQETQIRFTDPSSPPVTAPSGVDNWFGSRDAHDQ